MEGLSQVGSWVPASNISKLISIDFVHTHLVLHSDKLSRPANLKKTKCGLISIKEMNKHEKK